MVQLFTPDERRELKRKITVEQAFASIRRRRPGLLLQPHSNGQLQALCSDALYRILIPGNGWGKTTCMAMDLDFLMQRDDPFKPQVLPDPDRPTTAIWFCQKYQQFEVMQPYLESVFTKGFVWRAQHHVYEWPNGSRCFVVSSDSDWTTVQGIQLDAVYFDEHPDRKFWNEMQYRRRGESRTRYMVAATMTQGITWFVTSIIQPWERYCRDLGLTNQEALEKQPHPTTFVWNTGGIKDNPSAREGDIEHYASIATASEKERMVRLAGGYADFVGEPVFDLDSLARMEEQAKPGESGAIIFRPDEDGRLADRLIQAAGGYYIGHRFNGALDRRFFEWRPQMEVQGGRITIFEPPDPDEEGNYIIGADFAAGLEGKDYDAAVVGLKRSDGRVYQVAEAHGHWGDVFFAEVLYGLGVLYFEAFIVGERQFGLPCLRRLYDEMGYTYLYYQRRDESRTRRPSDLLGHHRHAGDTIIPNHQLAIRRGDIVLVSRDAIQEHKRYQFRPRKKDIAIDEVFRTGELTTGAPDGEFDDLVMAAAYMTHGAREIVHYAKPRRAYAPGTFGQVMRLDEVLRTRKKAVDPYRIRS